MNPILEFCSGSKQAYRMKVVKSAATVIAPAAEPLSLSAPPVLADVVLLGGAAGDPLPADALPEPGVEAFPPVVPLVAVPLVDVELPVVELLGVAPIAAA